MNVKKYFVPTLIFVSLSLYSVVNVFAGDNGIPNGNYSSVSISLLRENFATPICYGVDCHTGLGGLGLAGSYQFVPNLFIFLSSSSGQSTGSVSSIKVSNGQFGIGVVAGIGNIVDIGATISSISSTAEACDTTISFCVSLNDTGNDVGLFGRVWLDDQKKLDIGLGFDSASFSKSATKQSSSNIDFGLVLAEHHKLNLGFSKTKDSNGTALSDGIAFGYSYQF